jgi:hypothetical protein
MSIDSTSSSVYRKKILQSTLSQPAHYPYSKYLLKDHQQQPVRNSRAMSMTEENSGDILTDLTSLPCIPSKQVNNRQRNRRFSELKPPPQPPPVNQQTQKINSDRRNSIPQLSFSSLLPSAFRSNKHQHKNTTK